MGSFRNDYAKWSQEGRAEALGKADEFHKHPHVKHYHDAASHFKKAMEASVHGDDDEIVGHFDRGVRSLDKGDKKTGAKPVMGVKENLSDDQELDEVARATLQRYRAKAKAKLRASGGINAALEKQDRKDKESMNPNRKKAVNEAGFANKFAPLKKVAPNSGYGKDKSGKAAFMSSNPDMRINRRAGLDKDIDWENDGKGAYDKQQAKLAKYKARAKAMGDHNPMRKESAFELVARIMMDDEIPYSPYRETMEERCDRIADAKKEEIKMALFNFAKEED